MNENFFDTYYTTDGKSGAQDFTVETEIGIILPTIVYAKKCAKDHMQEVSFDDLKLSRCLSIFFLLSSF